jgi:hypothetical protein
MTDRSKFEQMLEHLVNDETDQAKELFHQLVVEKSRQIYEGILSEDFDVEESKDEDEEMEENFAMGEAEHEDGDDEGDIGGDASDDFVSDIEMDGDDEEGEEHMDGEGDVEDRVQDLEDALDDLRAEFEQLMAGEEAEEHDHPGIHDMGGDDMDMAPEEDEMDENDMFMREYVEKVGTVKHGDDGANTKSTVAGKNDMGGTSANIAKGGVASGEGTKGGLLNPSTKEENFGNMNTVPGKAGKAFTTRVSAGHGAEKKATGDNGANKKSTIGS